MLRHSDKTDLFDKIGVMSDIWTIWTISHLFSFLTNLYSFKRPDYLYRKSLFLQYTPNTRHAIILLLMSAWVYNQNPTAECFIKYTIFWLSELCSANFMLNNLERKLSIQCKICYPSLTYFKWSTVGKCKQENSHTYVYPLLWTIKPNFWI